MTPRRNAAEDLDSMDLLVPSTRKAVRSYGALMALLLAALLTPIWSSRYPAMLDYPNHLARAYILRHLGDVPAFASTYRAAWAPIPNLAIDLVVPALLHVADIEIASKLFLSLLIVLFAVGCHTLGAAAHGRPTWLALPAMFLVYNFFFSAGFVNYLFGLGIAFMGLALWIRSRRRWSAGTLLLAALAALAGYLSHLSAFGLLAVCAVLLTGLDALRSRHLSARSLVGFITLAPPLLLWAVELRRGMASSAWIWWHPLLAKKLIGLAYPIVSCHVYLDLALGALLAILLIAAYVAAPRRRMHADLVTIGCVLLGLYMFCPMEGSVQSTYLDRRLVVPAFVILFLAFNVDLPRRARRLLVGALLMLGLVRVGTIAEFWKGVSGEIESQVRLLDRLPEGARIYPIIMQDPSSLSHYPRDMCFKFVVHYGTIRRHTYCPSIYASSAAFPLRSIEGRTEYHEYRPETSFSDVDWDFVLSHYDYLWGYKLRGDDEGFLARRCDVVAREGHVVLFRTGRRDLLRNAGVRTRAAGRTQRPRDAPREIAWLRF